MTTQTLAQFQAQANPNDWILASNYASQYGIPDNIFHALVAQESSWNPTAQSPNSTSYGYTQLTAGTASDLGVNAQNPEDNLKGGAKYLSEMYAKFGNWSDALAHYNQGPNQTDPAKLVQGKQYADSVLAIAGTGMPASTGTVDKILAWIKAQLGNFVFLIIGGALIVVALLHNETVRTAAGDAVKTAAVA
jgi:soluble lytic murein transglycosylase-like protein